MVSCHKILKSVLIYLFITIRIRIKYVLIWTENVNLSLEGINCCVIIRIERHSSMVARPIIGNHITKLVNTGEVSCIFRFIIRIEKRLVLQKRIVINDVLVLLNHLLGFGFEIRA